MRRYIFSFENFNKLPYCGFLCLKRDQRVLTRDFTKFKWRYRLSHQSKKQSDKAHNKTSIIWSDSKRAHFSLWKKHFYNAFRIQNCKYAKYYDDHYSAQNGDPGPSSLETHRADMKTNSFILYKELSTHWERNCPRADEVFRLWLMCAC